MAKGERCRNEEESPDFDQYAKDALDVLFSKQQQTYEEFLQGFTFLKKEDVTGYKAKSSQIIGQQDKKTGDTIVKSLSSSESSNVTENDTIPEEILGPGSATPSILMRSADSSGKSFVQVDNFIDCKNDASDDEDEDSKMHDHGLLEDEIFYSSSYSPSVSSLCPVSTSKSEITTDQTRHQKENFTDDLDDKCLESKNIFYLSDGVSNLPGEVEDQETVDEEGKLDGLKESMEPNIRQLQISTRLKGDNLISEHILNVGSEGTDEVQPFTLDTEFDYDNVALTPKFKMVPGKQFLTINHRD
ncbi:unnamed protein product [Porites evermanni]|uniref:Uncharacterized protein n=1 Tax=Porites evermanni TaxID=104178 RepID=A0ABN8M2V0_9CNID|nr:unnamed protein product [Porites evermanni]